MRDMLVAVALFAVMQVCVKKLSHLPAVEVVFFRGAISALLCAAVFMREGIRPWGAPKQGLLLLRGALGTAALFLFFFTLQRLPLAAAVTLQYLSPIFTVVIAGWLFRERAQLMQWVAMALGFIGVVCMQGFDGRIPALLAFAAVGSAVLAAGAYNTIRAIGSDVRPIVIVFYFPLVTAVAMGLPTACVWVTPQGWDWAYVLGCGLAVQGAQVFMTRAYQQRPAAEVAPVLYSGALFAAVLGVLVFGEALTWGMALGMTLIVGSSLIATRAARRV